MDTITIFFIICYFIIGGFLLYESITSFVYKDKNAGIEFLVFFIIWLISFVIPIVKYLI